MDELMIDRLYQGSLQNLPPTPSKEHFKGSKDLSEMSKWEHVNMLWCETLPLHLPSTCPSPQPLHLENKSGVCLRIGIFCIALCNAKILIFLAYCGFPFSMYAVWYTWSGKTIWTVCYKSLGFNPSYPSYNNNKDTQLPIVYCRTSDQLLMPWRDTSQLFIPVR